MLVARNGVVGVAVFALAAIVLLSACETDPMAYDAVPSYCRGWLEAKGETRPEYSEGRFLVYDKQAQDGFEVRATWDETRFSIRTRWRAVTLPYDTPYDLVYAHNEDTMWGIEIQASCLG